MKEGCPLLKERLEKEWLEEIGVIPDKQAFQKVTLNTFSIFRKITKNKIGVKAILD